MYNLSTSEETVIISSKISVFAPKIHGDRIIWCETFKEDTSVVEDLTNFLKSSVRKTIEFIIRFPVGPHNPDDIKCNIWLYNLSTQEKTQIATRESYNAVPRIYGDNIVWEGSSDINGTSDLCLYNLSTHTKTQITTSGSAIAPIIYGNRIIYGDFSSGKHEIYMYDLSLSSEIPLPKNDSWQGAYAIYEDKLVIFHSEDQKTTDIYLHDLSTQQETKITTGRFATSPAIYGDRIVWMGNPYDIVNYNIYMYDFSTKKETQITTSGTAFDPIIYGDTIVWQDRQWKDDQSETDNIYICNLNSSRPLVTEFSESRMSGKTQVMGLLNLS
jgi:beta propeller repeat protein